MRLRKRMMKIANEEFNRDEDMDLLIDDVEKMAIDFASEAFREATNEMMTVESEGIKVSWKEEGENKYSFDVSDGYGVKIILNGNMNDLPQAKKIIEETMKNEGLEKEKYNIEDFDKGQSYTAEYVKQGLNNVQFDTGIYLTFNFDINEEIGLEIKERLKSKMDEFLSELTSNIVGGILDGIHETLKDMDVQKELDYVKENKEMSKELYSDMMKNVLYYSKPENK